MHNIIVDPVTRVSGLLSIEVQVENNKVVDAKAGGNQFRGFEKMFEGRSPLDMIRLTPRICGICSTHHALTSVRALEDAMKINPDENGRIIRDIANGFEFIQNYLRWTYFFVFPDYLEIITVNPLFKTETPKVADYRLDKVITNKINEDYVEAIRLSREAHKGLAVLAGKAPHPHGIWVGGITTNIDIPQIESCRYIITILKDFIINKLIPDVEIIAKAYSDYFKIGGGHRNLMSYGLYDNYAPPIQYSLPKVRINGKEEDLDINNITESVKYTWAVDNGQPLIPGKSNPASPDPKKQGAYSWINAPRYKGFAMEVGALARMTLSGEYKGGISTMDRILAKAYEAKRVCEITEELIKIAKLGKAVQKEWQVPSKALGVGLSEAERGSLAHWISINDKKVENYTVIPPSTWNISPKDDKGVRGTAEEALIGTEIQDITSPVEVGRILRSFDPCLSCAAHVTSDRHKAVTINILA